MSQLHYLEGEEWKQEPSCVSYVAAPHFHALALDVIWPVQRSKNKKEKAL